MSNQTLKKIEYSDITQFLEDINRNFGIVENSPLFMGVPGKPGPEGEDGLAGVRGSNFLFVNVQKFNEQFENEITLGNQIDVDYLNNKLANFESKNKLLLAFGIEKFVDKDVVVLTNSMMLSFNYGNNSFDETGQAFNPETNFLNGINQTIENYVSNYVNNHPAILGIKNIFTNYATLAKNYADNNSAFVSDSLLNSSVYSPYLPGFNNNVGVQIENHRYFGYNNEELPISLNSTLVQGSIRRYYQLLMSTLSTDSNQTLTSDYAPGVDNIPSLVLLQDTYKNGLYFGFKGKQNLKSFGSMFKNEQNEVVIKSDSSNKVNEYSELLIHATYMKYGKLAQFLADVEISRNLKVFGDIKHNLIRTGSLVNSLSNPININHLELGNSVNGGRTSLLSKDIWTTEYKSNVLVTDSTGKISHDYSLLTNILPENSIPNLNLITFENSINSDKKIVTANYLHYLIRKVNSIAQYVTDNYWRKNQYETGEIPALKLNDWFEVGNKANLGNQLLVDRLTSTTTIKSATTNIESNNIKLNKYLNNVLVTDSTGLIVKTYSLEKTQTNMSLDLTTGVIQNLQYLTTPENKILTSVYFNKLLELINAQANFNNGNYWRKNQYETGEIPGIVLAKKLHVNASNDLDVNLGNKFKVTNALSVLSSTINQIDNTLKLTNYQSNVLVTDSTGTVSNQYKLWNEEFSSTISIGINPYNNQQYQYLTLAYPVTSEPEKKIPTLKALKSLYEAFSKFNLMVNNLFWRKDQYYTGEIPNLWLSGNLLADGHYVEFGSVSDRNIVVNGTNTFLGSWNGDTVIKGQSITFIPFNGQVLVTDSTGTLRNDIWVETKHPQFWYWDDGDQFVQGQSNSNITTDTMYHDWFQWSGLETTEPIVLNSIPFDEKTLITGKHFKFLFYLFKAFKKYVNEKIYTKAQIDYLLESQIPINSVIMYDGNPSAINDKWVICDGRTYIDHAGVQRTAPNLIDKFVMGGTSAGNEGGANSITLTVDQMPAHNHTAFMGTSGAHTHSYLRDVHGAGGDHDYKISGGGGKFFRDRTRTTETAGSHTHSLTIRNTGSSKPFDNRPKYYSVIFIKRIKA